jgi:hypothetical protein
MRPAPSDGKQEAEQDPKLAGLDYWKGWCCDRCGMANERSSWRGWECEGCSQLYRPKRRIWTAAALAPPMRPVAQGPRIEDGFPLFPAGQTSRSSMVWDDGLKIVMHGLPDQTEIHHALVHYGGNSNKDADSAFEDLQQQGSAEIPFKRMPVLDSNGRGGMRPVLSLQLPLNIPSLHRLRSYLLPLLHVPLRSTRNPPNADLALGKTSAVGHLADVVLQDHPRHEQACLPNH